MGLIDTASGLADQARDIVGGLPKPPLPPVPSLPDPDIVTGAGEELHSILQDVANSVVGNPRPGPRDHDGEYTELDALDGLVGSWDDLNGRDAIVSEDDLRDIAGEDSDRGRAARYYLDHPAEFRALDTAANGGDGDSKVSIGDIRARQEQLGFDPTLQQISTHNSYERGASLTDQFENEGVRSFELDIYDYEGDSGTGNGEWSVRHDKEEESVGNLSEYLTEIKELDTDEPITLFIDLKDGPLDSAGHSPADLDQLLENEFGDRLYTPDDLIARAQEIDPTVSTVAEAVEVAGWPTDEELNGRIIVSITGGEDGLQDYQGADRPDGEGAGAFIAPEPTFVNGEFVPDPNAAVYNINANPYGPDEVRPGNERDGIASINQAVTEQGFLIRNYRVDENSADQLIASGATFIGTDHYEKIDVE